MVVVLEKGDVGEMKFGILKAIAFHRGEVFFGCTVFEACQSFIKKVSNFDIRNIRTIHSRPPSSVESCAYKQF